MMMRFACHVEKVGALLPKGKGAGLARSPHIQIMA
jgi:hypothetical protein